MVDLAVIVENLSKSYKLYNKPVDRLKESLHPLRKKYHRDFYALHGVNLEVGRGETIGIIGRNGSGKSTLLKILSGVLTPSGGSVRINGKVSALLELGTGFNPEMTGIENAYFNGTLMGCSKEEMDGKIDDILAFADIGDFASQPVRTYSSGMFVRLAFACAVHVDPDILIVDEALAVGDFKFRQKCAERINQLKSNTTVIIVSHSMRDIQMLCSRALVLDKGILAYQGPAHKAVEFYLAKMEAEEEERKKDSKSTKRKQPEIKVSPYGEVCNNAEKITDVVHRWVDADGQAVSSVEHGSAIALEFSFKILKPVKQLVIGVPIWNSKAQMVTALNSDKERIKIVFGEDGVVRGRLKVPYLAFNPGLYVSYFVVVDAKEFLYRNSIGEFRVREMPLYFGYVTLEHEWQFQNTGTSVQGDVCTRQ